MCLVSNNNTEKHKVMSFGNFSYNKYMQFQLHKQSSALFKMQLSLWWTDLIR